MIKTLVLAAVIFLLSACATVKAPPETVGQVGEARVFYAHCITREAAEDLSERIRLRNDVGYLEAMVDPTLPCYDIRMHGKDPEDSVVAELVEYGWTLVRPDGLTFEFWSARDSGGTVVWTWIGLGPDVSYDDEPKEQGLDA